ncbi:DUF397 domain-containing protein [Streptomyces sp. NPDC005538]|uniref:DUF397 domain-containing protein n=1 Tax=unclassified Streptomyces TaxID=2593676 RepID=UPI0033B02F31
MEDPLPSAPGAIGRAPNERRSVTEPLWLCASSSGATCVEVKMVEEFGVIVRDSKNPYLRVLWVSADAWNYFLLGLRDWGFQ